MRLIHYSNKHLTEVRSVKQTDEDERGDKPRGLWVSVEGDDDWKSWCEGESFALEYLTHPTEVILSQSANLLKISGANALRDFHKRYGCRAYYADRMSEPWRYEGYAIRWIDIAAQYDGIIIAPYVWDLRLDMGMRWYYGWDCASGCIWNSRAVAKLVPLHPAPDSDDRTNSSTDATGE